MTHKQYVSTLDKNEAKALIKAAQERVEELKREKAKLVESWQDAFHSRDIVKLFGEEVVVMSCKTNFGRFGEYEGDIFEFSNGSKIVINLD